MRFAMDIAGVDYQPLFNGAGTRGFFDEGYWYHPLWKLRGLTFLSYGFTAKTTTMQPRLDPKNKVGNMYMREDGITPKHLFPSCIVI